MAKRAKPKQPRVWERTLWAIQRADGTLVLNGWQVIWRFPYRRQAQTACNERACEKPVKVRERIEVIE